MDEVNSLQSAQHRLHAAIKNFRPPPPASLDISPYLGASLLQKAIRRGRTETALQAAATLLEQSPERLWRRLACIAFEDVGLGDPTSWRWQRPPWQGRECERYSGASGPSQAS
jgi:hypothetical protein